MAPQSHYSNACDGAGGVNGLCDSFCRGVQVCGICYEHVTFIWKRVARMFSIIFYGISLHIEAAYNCNCV